MAVSKEVASTKRFGPRYGRTVRHKLGKIEHEYKLKHKCNYCNAKKVERVSAGIWQCKKCGVKFAARAYSPKKSEIKFEEEAE